MVNATVQILVAEMVAAETVRYDAGSTSPVDGCLLRGVSMAGTSGAHSLPAYLVLFGYPGLPVGRTMYGVSSVRVIGAAGAVLHDIEI
jgi:hypothetical protein